MVRDTRQAFEAMVARWDPQVRAALLQAIADVKTAARAAVIEEAIAAGDVQAVIAALNLRDEYFAPLDNALRQAFIAGGAYQAEHLPGKPDRQGGPVVIRFNGAHPEAERLARERGARAVTGVTDSIREGIRVTVSEGIARGQSPRVTARALMGRGRTGQRRQGGQLGLSGPQARAVEAARDELADPGRLAAYLRRAKRDRRMDGTVRRAMREERALSASEIERLTTAYSDRLLRLRAETIARTETIGALNAGRMRQLAQMVENGDVPQSAIRVVWQATPDNRTRDIHAAMHGQEVAYGRPFRTASGAQLRYPGDASLGAPASEIVNCRCGLRIRVDWLSLAA